MTFVGFSVDRWTGNLIDFGTKQIIEKRILPRELGIALHQNKVNMNENFDILTRYVLFERKLCDLYNFCKSFKKMSPCLSKDFKTDTNYKFYGMPNTIFVLSFHH